MTDKPGVAAETSPQGPGLARFHQWRGWWRGVVFPLLILAAIVGGLWYFGVRDQGGEAPELAGGVRYGTVELPLEKNVTGKRPAGETGRAAPDFLLEQLDGPPLRFSDLQGRPVLVNFWATWCPPCRKEIPVLIKAYGENKSRGFLVVAVNLQEGDRPVRRFAQEFGMEFPIVMDRTGQVAQTWRIGGPIKGLPASYFVDRDGVIREVFFGAMNEDVLREKLAKILPAEGGP